MSSRVRKVEIRFNGAQRAGTGAKWLLKWLLMRKCRCWVPEFAIALPAKPDGLLYLSGSENTYNALPFPG